MDHYQNVTVDGKTYGKGERVRSRFFNEGKWRNFIAPLLPEPCPGMTFVEYGCNYGVLLKQALDWGFETVVGVERSVSVARIARRYLGPGAEILRGEVNDSVFRGKQVADLPAADVVLMANFHYHLYPEVLLHLLNLWRRKARALIVVSVEGLGSKLYRAQASLDRVRRYCEGWSEARVINGVPTAGDPAPRKGMYSVLFTTGIRRVPVADIVAKFGPYGRRYYRKVKRDMAASGERTPLTWPILLRENGSVMDGHHRLAGVELDGGETILAERI